MSLASGAAFLPFCLVDVFVVAVVVVVPDVPMDIVWKTSYDERWAAFAKLVALPVKKVVFNAQARSKTRTIGARTVTSCCLEHPSIAEHMVWHGWTIFFFVSCQRWMSTSRVLHTFCLSQTSVLVSLVHKRVRV